MSVEGALTGFMLQIVKEEVTRYINIKSGEKHEIESLNNELRLLAAFINDSAKRSKKREVFKEMERQIRELVYDVEDILETCLAKKAAAKTKNFFLRQVQKVSISLEKKVKFLREGRVLPVIREITKEFGRIEFHDGSTVKNQEETMAAAPSVRVYTEDQSKGQSSSQSNSGQEDKVVDVEDHETIINYLMETKKELDVISVTGMAGLGKTTLARRVLDDPKVVSKFPVRIGIQVSQKFNGREVFLAILKELAPEHKSNPSDEDLISAIHGCLANTKFLLVLDDIWKVNDWNEIKEILPSGNSEGKVLVTSWDVNVARRACSIGRIPHEMSQLGPEKSWELLKLNVFGRFKECPKDLEVIGEAIASKCGGSPLIIRVIGGILEDHVKSELAIPDIQEKWENLYEIKMWVTIC